MKHHLTRIELADSMPRGAMAVTGPADDAATDQRLLAGLSSSIRGEP